MSPAPPNQADNAILVVDDIVVRFDTPDGPITAVDDVSFKVRPGEFLSVIGPSGCGKSTLFNVIGGLLSNHAGVVSVAGETISGPHKSIGMVFQEELTFPWRTVIDNVAFPLELVGMERAKRAERARYFISLVGLDGFENRYPGELSGGMRQRVSLARTLASEPKILLMDEPFAALDEQTRLLLGDKVLQIQQQLKQTTLLHYPQHHRSGADVRPYPGDDLPARQDEAHRRYGSAAPAHLGNRRQRGLRPLRRANLEATCAKRRAAACVTRNPTCCITKADRRDRRRARKSFEARQSCRHRRRPRLARGIFCGRRLLIQISVINRFIVPPPSEIIGSFYRVIDEEHVFGFLLTATECLPPASC